MISAAEVMPRSFAILMTQRKVSVRILAFECVNDRSWQTLSFLPSIQNNMITNMISFNFQHHHELFVKAFSDVQKSLLLRFAEIRHMRHWRSDRRYSSLP